jgi:hypothetical protein
LRCASAAGGLALAFVLGVSSPAQATDLIELKLQQAEAADQFQSDALLLLSLELDALPVAESLAAYGDPADPMVPLGELARLLDLDVTVAPLQGVVTGRLGEARRPLKIDLSERLVRVAGRDVALGRDDLAVTSADVYVRASALERLLPVTVEADAEAMTLRLTALEQLPLQARLERVARQRDLRPDAETKDPTLTLKAPYRALSAPAFDLAFDVAADSRTGDISRRYDLRSAGDLLGANVQAYLGSDEQGRPADARLTFERREADGGLLGPLNATAVSAGDVFTPGLGLGPRSQGGRGFALSTAPLEQPSVFDRIDLRGELPAGSDVELYVNDVLRSGQRTPVQGRYEFLDVPLVRGTNVIRIVTYGARGERSEQTQVVNVGGGQLEPGQHTFDFGVAQQERPLVDFRSAEEAAAGNPAAGSTRAVFSAAYGLNRRLTLVGGGALYSVAPGEHRRLATLGARTGAFGLALQADAAVEDTGGAGFALGVAGQPFGVSAVARHAEYRDGFLDESRPGADPRRPLLRHTELSADTSLPFPGERILPLSMRVQRLARADDSVETLAAARISTTLAGTLLSTGADVIDERSPTHRSRRATGVFAASRLFADSWQLRSAVDYQLGPELMLSAASLTADREVSRDLALRLGLGQTFGEGEETSVQGGAVIRTPVGDVALSADYVTPRNDWRLGMRVAFGLTPGLRGPGYALTRPGPASGASAVFHAFVDADGDGRFDPGEEPVASAGLEGGERDVVTGADGRGFVTGLGASPRTRVQVKLDAIEDPYLQSPPQAVEFAPRPGLVMKVPYPLTPTGDVMARVVLRKPDGRLTGLSAVRIRLSREGGAAREAVTEFDGSAHFEHLTAGTYRLELDPEQAARLGMQLAEAAVVEMDPAQNPLVDLVAEVGFGLRAPRMILASAEPVPERDLIAELLAGGPPPSDDVIGDLLTMAAAT